MAVQVADLVAKLRADISEFERGFDKASRKSRETTRGIEEHFRTLGVRTSKDIEQARQKYQQAFDQIKRSGTASAGDLAKAQTALKDRLAETGEETAGLSGRMRDAAAAMRASGAAAGPLGALLSGLTSMAGLAAVGFGAITLGLRELSQTMTQNVRQVRDLVAVSGLSAEAADNLADTFELLGFDANALHVALFRMADQIDSGGKALDRLGVSARRGTGEMKAEGELFLEIRDRISAMGSAYERSAALKDLFGRAGLQLASIFALEREEFKKFMAEAAALSPWNEQMQRYATQHMVAVNRLGKAWEGFKLEAAKGIIPVLTAMFEALGNVLARLNKLPPALEKAAKAARKMPPPSLAELGVTGLVPEGIEVGAPPLAFRDIEALRLTAAAVAKPVVPTPSETEALDALTERLKVIQMTEADRRIFALTKELEELVRKTGPATREAKALADEIVRLTKLDPSAAFARLVEQLAATDAAMMAGLEPWTVLSREQQEMIALLEGLEAEYKGFTEAIEKSQPPLDEQAELIKGIEKEYEGFSTAVEQATGTVAETPEALVALRREAKFVAMEILQGAKAATEARAAWDLFKKSVESLTLAERDQLREFLMLREATTEVADIKSAWADVFGSIEGFIEHAVAGIIQGTTTIKQIMKNLSSFLIVEFSGRILKLALAPIIGALVNIMTALTATGTISAATLGQLGAGFMKSLPFLAGFGGLAGTGLFGAGGLQQLGAVITMGTNLFGMVNSLMGGLGIGFGALAGFGGGFLSLIGSFIEGTMGQVLSGFGGALSLGALGFTVAGPIGAIIGGLLGGLFGGLFGGKKKKRTPSFAMDWLFPGFKLTDEGLTLQPFEILGFSMKNVKFDTAAFAAEVQQRVMEAAQIWEAIFELFPHDVLERLEAAIQKGNQDVQERLKWKLSGKDMLDKFRRMIPDAFADAYIWPLNQAFAFAIEDLVEEFPELTAVLLDPLRNMQDELAGLTDIAMAAITDEAFNQKLLGLTQDFMDFIKGIRTFAETLTEVVTGITMGTPELLGPKPFGDPLTAVVLRFRTLEEQLQQEIDAIAEGEVPDLDRINALVRERYDLEIQFLGQIESLIAGIQASIEQQIFGIQFEMAEPEAQFAMLTDEVEKLVDRLQLSIDPSEIAELTQQIQGLIGQIWAGREAWDQFGVVPEQLAVILEDALRTLQTAVTQRLRDIQALARARDQIFFDQLIKISEDFGLAVSVTEDQLDQLGFSLLEATFAVKRLQDAGIVLADVLTEGILTWEEAVAQVAAMRDELVVLAATVNALVETMDVEGLVETWAAMQPILEFFSRNLADVAEILGVMADELAQVIEDAGRSMMTAMRDIIIALGEEMTRLIADQGGDAAAMAGDQLALLVGAAADVERLLQAIESDVELSARTFGMSVTELAEGIADIRRVLDEQVGEVLRDLDAELDAMVESFEAAAEALDWTMLTDLQVQITGIVDLFGTELEFVASALGMTVEELEDRLAQITEDLEATVAALAVAASEETTAAILAFEEAAAALDAAAMVEAQQRLIDVTAFMEQNMETMAAALGMTVEELTAELDQAAQDIETLLGPVIDDLVFQLGDLSKQFAEAFVAGDIEAMTEAAAAINDILTLFEMNLELVAETLSALTGIPITPEQVQMAIDQIRTAMEAAFAHVGAPPPWEFGFGFKVPDQPSVGEEAILGSLAEIAGLLGDIAALLAPLEGRLSDLSTMPSVGEQAIVDELGEIKTLLSDLSTMLSRHLQAILAMTVITAAVGITELLTSRFEEWLPTIENIAKTFITGEAGFQHGGAGIVPAGGRRLALVEPGELLSVTPPGEVPQFSDGARAGDGDLTVVLRMNERELARATAKGFRRRTLGGAKDIATDLTFEKRRG